MFEGKVGIFGVQIDNIDMAGALARVEGALAEESLCRVVTPNPEILLKARVSEAYRDMLNRAELSVPDGFGLVLFSELSGVTTGVDLCEKVAEMACRKGYRLFLLGAGLGVAQKAADRWMERYPGLQVVGAFSDCGYGKEDVGKIAQKINYAKADIVMVAFGAPNQESWIFEYCHLMPGVCVWMGIGGSLDFVAGVVKRAPRWMRFLHFEWFYRLLTQPRRALRIWNALVVFSWLMMFGRKQN